jgi:lysozyme
MFKAMIQFIKSIIKGIIDLKETTQELSGYRQVSPDAALMIKEFEGFRENAYLDSAGVWTIGYGNTYYADGTPVKKGDKISRSDAELLFDDVLESFADEVNQLITVKINDCQFGAIVSLSYNIGITAFKKSTLLRKLNANPNDPAIEAEFARWIKAGGKTLNGLVKRRKKESDYYFNQNC